MKRILYTAMLLCLAGILPAQVTQQVTAIQYYFNTDPGVGIPGNGAIIPVTPTDNFNQALAITLPGTVTSGFQSLYVRARDENNRWSLAERRLFYVSQAFTVSGDVAAYQYYFDTDPGVGIPGNGAVIPVTPTAAFNQTIAITIPNTLIGGFHNLYLRVQNSTGQWSLIERRAFIIQSLTATNDLVAYQYYFDTDPGVGVTGNGAVVPIAATGTFNQTIAISVPNTLSSGFHNFYLRAQNTSGAWSLVERRAFIIQPLATTNDLIAYQYYFDTDPGVGVTGNGAVVPIAATGTFNQTIAISVPNTLNSGFHNLYIRTQNTSGAWSLIERRAFILDQSFVIYNIEALEYYFDVDPGVGNGNPYPVSSTGAFNATVDFVAPCLTTGLHYLYVRARNTVGKWSIIERDTVSITSGLQASVITPSGPVSFCAGDSMLLSINQVAGATFQWKLNGTDITGATGITHYATMAGNYTVEVNCGASFSNSNTVSVNVLPLNTYYADADGDTYGDPASTTTGCTQPAGYVTNNTDCNDANPNIHPGMTEICNGIDDNCNSLMDDGLTFLTYYTDADSDGYGDPLDPGTSSCIAMAGKVTNNADCNDANSNVNPAATEVCNGIDDDCDSQIDEGVTTTYYADVDGDGYGNLTSSVQACTQPSGYVTIAGDCNDNNAAVNPVATEVCNGIDDDCDSQVDEGVTNTYYADVDGDGYGNPASSVQACTQPAGYVADNSDCDDGNTLIHTPVEYYVDADADGYGSTISAWVCSLTPPPGYASNNSDCDDTNGSVHPGATEICNGIDDDCNALTDDADPGVTGQPVWYVDADGDGFGSSATTISACVQPSGYVSNDNDCDDSNNAIHAPVQYYVDMDGDGYGSPVTAMLCSLTAPAGYSSNNQDCNDGNSSINPGAAEACNGIDDDCNTLVDDGFPTSTAATAVNSTNGTSFCASSGTTLSVSGGSLAPGASWVWYEGGCGAGITIGTGATLAITPIAGSYNYFVRAEGTCDLSACVSISLTVTDVPSFLSCPGTLSVNTTVGQCSAMASYSVVATGSPVFTYSFSGSTTGMGSGTGSGAVFNQGTTTVTITATNACGSDQCVFDVNVVDNEDPVISGCPSNIVDEIDEGQWGATVTWTAPTAGDNCGMGTLTASHAPGSFFNVGTTVVTYTATDINANIATCSFNVTVNPPDPFAGLNVSIYTSGITFSNNNPAVSSTVNVSAVIQNNSRENAGTFKVRLKEMFTNTTYPVITVGGLNAYQSTQVSWVVNTPNVDAFVPVLIEIDVDNDLTEINEYDNEATKPFICGNPAINGSMSVATNPVPASVPAGSVIQLCGSATYDVTPPLPDPSVAGALVTITVIETGYTVTGYTNNLGQFCISYITPNTAGTYHYTVDVSDNTLNGDVSGTFTTTAPVIVCPLDVYPSIAISGIGVNGYGAHSATVGSSMSATVTVHNSCTQVTQSTVLFVTFPAGVSPSTASYPIPPLAPGASHTVSLGSMTLNVIGNTYIAATADYLNILNEVGYESNNTAMLSIQVLPLLPDLAVMTGSVLSPYECTVPNQAIFHVKNIGTAASGSFEAVFRRYTNGILQPLVTQPVFNLNPQQDTVLRFTIVPTLLPDSFSLEVDLPTYVTEMVEIANNRLGFPYQFQPCHSDLIVLGCSYTDVKPADPVQGNALNVSFSITNTGQLPVTSPFNVEVSSGVSTVLVPVNTPMYNGTVLNLTASVTAPAPATQSLVVTADVSNVINEGIHESNNSYSAPLCHEFTLINLNCYGIPIFASTQQYCNPGVFAIGLVNNGIYEATSAKVKYEISGPGLSGWVDLGTTSLYFDNTCGCPQVVAAPGSFYFPQTGTYQVKMTSDPLNNYTECDESNNQIIMSVNVIETVDYKVLSSYITPSDLNPDINEVISFNVAYSNVGCSGFSTLELLSTMDNQFLATQTVPPLPGGGINSVAVPATWSSAVPGTHVFRAFIDANNQFNEGDESNNEATRAVIVGDAPDYKVVTLVSSSNNPLHGDLITLTANLTNEGASMGAGTLRFLYEDPVNGEQLLLEEAISIAPGNTLIRTANWIVTNPTARIIARIVNVTPLEFDLSDNEQDLQLNLMQVTLTASDVLCNGDATGTITIAVSGGQIPYSYSWNAPGLFGNSVMVTSGSYSVVVTDANGVTASASVTVNEPDALMLSDTHVDASCDTESDGSVDLSVAGGIAPYVYSWSNAATSQDLNNLSAGVYTVSVTDDNGCSESLSVTIQNQNTATVWYADVDGDTYGDATTSTLACTQPTGYVANDDDCNDTNANVHPAATEICNGMDDDCDGLTDDADPSVVGQSTWYADADGDTYGDATTSTLACTQPTGYVANDDDCNDANANVHPAATEICNGLDDDCDGLTDDADPSVVGQSTWYADADGDTYGDATTSTLACTQPTGYVANDDDCNDTNANINPAATEICNGLDDDCDGLTDDADPSVVGQSTWYADADGDGFGNPNSSLLACFKPLNYVSVSTDCDDANSAVYPGAPEVCNNGIDDNCDGQVDENCGCTNNTSPVVTSVTASPDIIPQYSTTTITATFTDDPNGGPYEIRFNWNDGTAQTIITIPGDASGSYTVSASHTYNGSAVFEPNVRVFDGCGAVSAQVPGVSSVQYLVVYVIGSQFTTMGGWFNTPSGSYMADPSFNGKVNMGNVVKPLNGAFKGELELNINAKNFKVHAVNPTTWDYLTVSGCCFAQFRGSCKINNVTGYKVLVAQTDHNYSCGQFGGNNMVRVKVWDQTTGQVIYDTQPGDPDNATPTTPLNGGSIKVHTQNSCVARPIELSYAVTLYPNPADDLLNVNITLDSDQPLEIRMIDMTGRMVQRMSLRGTRGYNYSAIPVHELKRGVYFIEVHGDSGVLREKIVLH